MRSTDVALAFVLIEDDGAPEPPPPLEVFAFLPLRSYGLRFILHADWQERERMLLLMPAV